MRNVLLVCSLLLVAACDGKFEIVRAGNQTFLLNRTNGEAQVVEGASLVKVQPRPPAVPDESLAKVRNWPIQDIPQLGGIKLSVRTKHRDGQLLYEAIASPYQGRLEKEFTFRGDYLRKPTLMLDFQDGDGFHAGEPIELPVRAGTRMVNDKGEPYALTWNGGQPMSIETYRALQSQGTRWFGFEEAAKP